MGGAGAAVDADEERFVGRGVEGPAGGNVGDAGEVGGVGEGESEGREGGLRVAGEDLEGVVTGHNGGKGKVESERKIRCGCWVLYSNPLEDRWHSFFSAMSEVE